MRSFCNASSNSRDLAVLRGVYHENRVGLYSMCLNVPLPPPSQSKVFFSLGIVFALTLFFNSLNSSSCMNLAPIASTRPS